MDATIEPIATDDWLSVAGRSEARFVQSLAELGLDARPYLAQYRQVRLDSTTVFTPEADLVPADPTIGRYTRIFQYHGRYGPTYKYFDERGFVDKMRDWFAGREFRIEDRVRRSAYLPLFHLEAPGTPGSESVYTKSTTQSRMVGFSVKVMGVGTGADQTVSVSSEMVVTAVDSEAKLVSLPISFNVQRIGVYERDRRVSEGVRLQMVKPRKKKAVSLRVETVDRIPPLLAQVHHIGAYTYDLSGDKGTKSTSETITLSSSHTFELALAIEAFDSEFGPKASVTNENAIAVKVSLPPGRVYTLSWLAQPAGITCQFQ